MFSARSEFRLSLRGDNADRRLTSKGARVGCVGEARVTAFEQKQRQLALLRQELDAFTLRNSEWEALGLPTPRKRQKASTDRPDAEDARVSTPAGHSTARDVLGNVELSLVDMLRRCPSLVCRPSSSASVRLNLTLC